MGTILDGKAMAAEIKKRVGGEIRTLGEKTGAVPGLTVIIVGEDPASRGYVRNKQKTAARLGIDSQLIEKPASVSAEELTAIIKKLNQDPAVNAILVQLPLPGHLDPWAILGHLDPAKDADRILAHNLGQILLDRTSIFPCTPAGILYMLDHHQIDIAGMEVVIVGRSLIVGKPLAAMMTNRNATVTVCHSRTRNLPDVTRRADLLVAAVGHPGFIQPDMVRSGAILIDVGTNYLRDGEQVKQHCSEKQQARFADKGYGICGDIALSALDRASHYSPVPGGVGPLTIAMLMSNTLELFKEQRSL